MLLQSVEVPPGLDGLANLGRVRATASRNCGIVISGARIAAFPSKTGNRHPSREASFPRVQKAKSLQARWKIGFVLPNVVVNELDPAGRLLRSLGLNVQLERNLPPRSCIRRAFSGRTSRFTSS